MPAHWDRDPAGAGDRGAGGRPYLCCLPCAYAPSPAVAMEPHTSLDARISAQRAAASTGWKWTRAWRWCSGARSDSRDNKAPRSEQFSPLCARARPELCQRFASLSNSGTNEPNKEHEFARPRTENAEHAFAGGTNLDRHNLRDGGEERPNEARLALVDTVAFTPEPGEKHTNARYLKACAARRPRQRRPSTSPTAKAVTGD